MNYPENYDKSNYTVPPENNKGGWCGLISILIIAILLIITLHNIFQP